MNGVYYDPAANGHYVSIQRIHDNGDVLVIWNTFDHKGNPAWIYGVGQITDKHIHAAMSQNLGGVLQVGGPAVGSTVRSWGTVDIDLTSCLLAQFNYQSSLFEFGSGQFPLTRSRDSCGFRLQRLARIKQKGSATSAIVVATNDRVQLEQQFFTSTRLWGS